METRSRAFAGDVPSSLVSAVVDDSAAYRPETVRPRCWPGLDAADSRRCRRQGGRPVRRLRYVHAVQRSVPRQCDLRWAAHATHLG
jgi:hypothetical protein